jgi:hypothetical protein
LKDKMMDVFSKTRRVTDVFLTLLIELPWLKTVSGWKVDSTFKDVLKFLKIKYSRSLRKSWNVFKQAGLPVYLNSTQQKWFGTQRIKWVKVCLIALSPIIFGLAIIISIDIDLEEKA